MQIVVDRNNPCVAEAFQQFGNVRALPTSEITKEAVRDADILIIRSETKVTKELLDGSSVKFVGSATIGTDHVDLEYLKSSSREFSSAPGSNANSVAEYILAALLHLSQKHSFSLRGTSIGVVGVGNVGSKVVRNATALGMTVLQNDPPLARTTGQTHFLPLSALMECDVITLHVPLIVKGEDPTYHLFLRERILKMKKGAILINTSRGPVVEGQGLKQALESKHLSGAVLDVWENEPSIDIDLLGLVDIATPHIAGYSYDGKVAAVKMLYDEACRHFHQPIVWFPENSAPAVSHTPIIADTNISDPEKMIYEIVRQGYDIEKDDKKLRTIRTIPESERPAFFRRLRSEYPIRREFFNSRVKGSPDHASKILTQIGYQLH